MEEPDVNESVEDQVTGSSVQGDVAEGTPEHAAQVAASEGVSEDAPAPTGDSDGGTPDGPAGPPLSYATGMGLDDQSDEADLVCTVHGGELRPAPGKWRWVCDRTQEPGSCVAGYRE